MPIECVWALSDSSILRFSHRYYRRYKELCDHKDAALVVLQHGIAMRRAQRMLSSRTRNAGLKKSNALKHVWLE